MATYNDKYYKKKLQMEEGIYVTKVKAPSRFGILEYYVGFAHKRPCPWTINTAVTTYPDSKDSGVLFAYTVEDYYEKYLDCKIKYNEDRIAKLLEKKD